MAHNEQGFAQGFALCKIQVVRSPEGLRAGAKPCSLYGKPEGISVQRFGAWRSGGLLALKLIRITTVQPCKSAQ